MPWKNIISFVLAFLAFGCLFTIGAAIAAHSTLGVILAILGVIVFMGTGFTVKRKFKETQG
ncbi:MAG TPA: DUF5325 family protein [Bacillales bacterium]|nr:DUF5325 family protein [Bacillales bacterium]